VSTGSEASTEQESAVNPSNHPNDSTTTLAHGQFHQSDSITVELIGPNNEPARVRITWPSHPTITTTAKYTEAAATAMRILANASTELARMKAGRRRG
jgi:hypothetical protein